MDPTTQGLLDFSDWVWGEQPGQVYLATLEKGGNFQQFMLPWPKSRLAIPRFILGQAAEGKDVYIAPALFVTEEATVERNNKGKTAATRANVQGSNVSWVDFDNGAAPQDWPLFAKEKGIPEPSLVIQSSVEGNQHVYWRTEFEDSVDNLEQRNRSLALTVGADRSGWDGNQLLRPPYTTNFGYKGDGNHKAWFRGQPNAVTVLGSASSERLNRDHFSGIAVAEKELLERLQLADSYPRIESVLAFGKWTEDLYTQFSMTQDEASESSKDKRSGALMKLTYLAAEAGMSDDQIYSILDNADVRWEKYATRSPGIRHKLLADMIARARLKVGYVTDEMLTFAGLLDKATVATEAPKLIYSWDEFMQAEFNVEWLIDGVLSTTGYGVITGQPGVGKTQVGLQFAISLALGHSNIFGFHVEGGARKGIMFSLEMGKESLKHIGEKINRQYPGQEREIGKNFKVVPLGRPINILTAEGRAFIENLLSEHQPDFLYIDSLKKIMSKSLNDDEGIRMMNDAIQEIREKHRCAVYVVHHDRKNQGGKKNFDPGELSDMYGSQYIAAEADFVLSLKKTPEKGLIEMDHWKVRLAEEPMPKYLRRNENLQFTVEDRLDEDIRIFTVGGSDGKDSDPDENGTHFRL